ncbi:MAG: thioredoxin domain-containing protein [Planctomycetes bacterium]|nr:thioredoxin domain-containing protein [Planctomycetota bacterium]
MSRTDIENKSAETVNRLADASSPYLLQHKHNPVDWYPWGEEAFEKAVREDKPVFLSIGYSTCHWCHVMAHESFEDLEVARLMNEAFVSIKVDREERPDIDGIYMTVCQMITGRGGWPLTIIMTPDQKPFFAATYIPKETRFGRIGMLELIPRIREFWETRRDEVTRSSERITDALRNTNQDMKGGALGPETLDQAFDQLASRFDKAHGGFGQAPKFPTPHNLSFLLRYAKRSGNGQALAMVVKTLEAMQQGGVYDHLGYGFHRYSTDEKWLVPHFEKMLYDQAQLALVYLEAFQITGDPSFRETAEQAFEYVLRDMTSPEGGFYSAEDADSDGEEGKFYVWTETEIRETLDSEEADVILSLFNVTKDGNFLDESSSEKTGANILHLRTSLEQAATDRGLTAEDFRILLEKAREKLFLLRERRIHPSKDDKILTDWNGLMISALARGAFILQEPGYAAAARRAADFVLQRLRTSEGRLLHRYRSGEAGIPAHLEDYAFLVAGLLNLYEATFDPEYLETAATLNTDMIRHFWDKEGGGLFFTADDSESLILRRKEIDDGAIPSGNSVAMLNLVRLSRMLGDAALEALAQELGAAFASRIERYPSAYTQFMVALDMALAPSQELVISGRLDGHDTQAMIRSLSSRFYPHLVLVFRPDDEKDSPIARLAPFTENQVALDGKATAYVCSGFECSKPVTDPAEMLLLLDGGL